MQEPPDGKWRAYSPENTIRYYALRLHEAGATKSHPEKIISKGTDWCFLNDLKKELKGKGSEGEECPVPGVWPLRNSTLYFGYYTFQRVS